ncbi:MAG: phospholipase D-like domain-containing protein, partial [Candidatus Thorarchaeota archaeon]
KTEEVLKCPDCKKWYLAVEGCTGCKSTEESRGDLVFVSDEGTAPLIQDMLHRAEDSVMIASPWIWGIEDIVQTLEQLREEKVDIAILTRRSGETDSEHEKTVNEIRGFGCIIDFIDELHAKIVLVDEAELYIGSANLVGTSMERNKEAGIWTDDPATVSDAKDYLADAFTAAFKERMQK